MKLSTTQKRRLAGLCPGCGIKNETDKHYCSDCTIIMRERARERRKLYPHRCSRCKARDPQADSAYCSKCQESSRIASIKHRDKIKQHVFNTYGGKCICCGNINSRIFTLDHINDDGNIHRQEIKIPMVRWAYNNDCPDILQILCANCHHIKTYYGKCDPSDHVICLELLAHSSNVN